jgi:quercetin dioxygenase-like cupin family protein
MTHHNRKLLSLALSLVFALAGVLPYDSFARETSSRKLLEQKFDARPVQQIEIGDFRFAPGQLGPRHSHLAPVFGYVSKGSIYYQVEGQQPVILKEGDAFFEPAGPAILHFDNASKTEEAAFTDINFEREGEPSIVFPTPPTERVDRRSFASTWLKGVHADSMQIVEEHIAPAATVSARVARETVVVYVAQGAVSVAVRGEAPIVYHAGQTFYQPQRSANTRVVNASRTTETTLIRFRLSGRGTR